MDHYFIICIGLDDQKRQKLIEIIDAQLSNVLPKIDEERNEEIY